MKNEKILIVGANGTVGTELVRILKSEGQKIKSTTSKESYIKDGVEYSQVNLATGEGVHKAFEGVEKAFLLSPPGHADQYKILSPLVQEAKRRGLKKVVLMTAMGANASDATPFRKAEIELEKSGLNYNIIRPNWFFQNFNTFWGQGIKNEFKIALPAASAKVGFIDTRDVSEVAAKLLVSDAFNNKDFDLSGPAAVDHDEVAAEISKVISKKITYENIAPEKLGATLLSWGLPKDYVDFMLLIFGFLREGYNSRVTPNVEIITGKAPRSLAQYAADFKTSW